MAIPRIRPVPRERPRRGRSLPWLAVGATACLATGLLALLVRTAEPPAAPRKAPPPAADDPDFPRKPPPKPGDWLHAFPESGQTVEAYKEDCRVRKRAGRETIVIQPMGGILKNHKNVIEAVREYAGLFYHCKAETAELIPMPAEDYVAKRRQYDADRLLVHLQNRVPGKAIAYFGFCEEDLFSGDLNFVFGVASLRHRMGVYSLARYGPKDERDADDEPVSLKRALKVASHEIGHLFGMEHCVRYQCVLNGANSVREMDGEPMYFCPECHEKARWNTGFDVRDRYLKLAAFYDTSAFKKDAAFAHRQAEKWKAKTGER